MLLQKLSYTRNTTELILYPCPPVWEAGSGITAGWAGSGAFILFWILGWLDVRIGQYGMWISWAFPSWGISFFWLILWKVSKLKIKILQCFHIWWLGSPTKHFSSPKWTPRSWLAYTSCGCTDHRLREASQVASLMGSYYIYYCLDMIFYTLYIWWKTITHHDPPNPSRKPEGGDTGGGVSAATAVCLAGGVTIEATDGAGDGAWGVAVALVSDRAGCGGTTSCKRSGSPDGLPSLPSSSELSSYEEFVASSSVAESSKVLMNHNGYNLYKTKFRMWAWLKTFHHLCRVPKETLKNLKRVLLGNGLRLGLREDLGDFILPMLVMKDWPGDM